MMENITPTVAAQLYWLVSVAETTNKPMVEELKFGPPGPTTDCDGYEYVPHSVKDYAYFSYIDTCSEEYEESVLINGVNMFEYIKIPDGAEMVVILSEG